MLPELVESVKGGPGLAGLRVPPQDRRSLRTGSLKQGLDLDLVIEQVVAQFDQAIRE